MEIKLGDEKIFILNWDLNAFFGQKITLEYNYHVKNVIYFYEWCKNPKEKSITASDKKREEVSLKMFTAEIFSNEDFRTSLKHK